MYGSEIPSIIHTPFTDLTDLTLADEDRNSMPTDDANRVIVGNVAMQVALSYGQIVTLSIIYKKRKLFVKFATNAMQYKLHHLVVKFGTNASAAIQRDL